MSDEPPFISVSDDPAPDPWLEFKRTLELTGERWLNHPEAIDLLREHEPMPIGAAEAILDDLRERYFAGRKPGVRWHWFHDDDFLLNKPNRGNTFVSEADLVFWHDNHRTSAPSHEANARRKKDAVQIERTKQAIKVKCQNGPLVLSKSMRNSLRDEVKVSDRTISRALKELRDAQPNRAK